MVIFTNEIILRIALNSQNKLTWTNCYGKHRSRKLKTDQRHTTAAYSMQQLEHGIILVVEISTD